MAEALYRKYRPKTFDSVVGQHHVLQTLKNEIVANKLSHAYLFCGPRGTGKTTMARILAKACLCSHGKYDKSPTTEPCGECQDCTDISTSQHPDVYELDAASRTGVENVREEIISRVQFAATRGKYKIYIVDEVHMLSTAAFNALLKTLEEPPSHVIFILCTTDPQKVPETILSRCQRFDFKPISKEDIVSRLEYVCQQEGIEAEKNALEAIADNAQGAMRNALTQLEQLMSYSNEKITLEDVKTGFSQNSNIDLNKLLESIGRRNLKGCFAWTEEYCSSGADFNFLVNQLIDEVKKMYINSAEGYFQMQEDKDILQYFSTDRLHRLLILLGDLIQELKYSSNARLAFEVMLSKAARPKSDLTLESLSERVSELEEKINNVLKNRNFNTQAFQHTKNGSAGSQGNGEPNNTFDESDNNALDSSRNNLYENSVNDAYEGPVDNTYEGPEVNTYDDTYEGPEDNTYDDTYYDLTDNSFDVPIDTSFNNAGNVASDNADNTTFDNTPQYSSDDEVNNIFSNSLDGAYNSSIDSASDNSDTKQQDSTSKNLNNKKSWPAHPVIFDLDLGNDKTLHKTWHTIFLNIKKKYPGYGAILMMANPRYKKDTNEFRLEFPPSAEFAISALKKPETREKVMEEIKKVIGNDIDIVLIKKAAHVKSNFNPSFTDGFREDKHQNNNNSEENSDSNSGNNYENNFDNNSNNNSENLNANNHENNYKNNYENTFENTKTGIDVNIKTDTNSYVGADTNIYTESNAKSYTGAGNNTYAEVESDAYTEANTEADLLQNDSEQNNADDSSNNLKNMLKSHGIIDMIEEEIDNIKQDR